MAGSTFLGRCLSRRHPKIAIVIQRGGNIASINVTKALVEAGGAILKVSLDDGYVVEYIIAGINRLLLAAQPNHRNIGICLLNAKPAAGSASSIVKIKRFCSSRPPQPLPWEFSRR